MTYSCRRAPKVWASWRGENGRPVIFHLGDGDQIPAPKAFAIHLGPLLMVAAVVEEEGVRLELREFVEAHD